MLVKMKEDLNKLIEKRRTELSARIADAEERLDGAKKRRELAAEDGDFRENTPYQSAVEDMAQLNVAIAKLNNQRAAFDKYADTIPSAVVIGPGTMIEVVRLDTKTTYRFLVTPHEIADSRSNLLSVTSPLGKEVFGKKQGDVVSISTSKYKNLEYKIGGII